MQDCTQPSATLLTSGFSIYFVIFDEIEETSFSVDLISHSTYQE